MSLRLRPPDARNLRQRLELLPPGSTVTLEAGRYELPEALTLLHDVRFVGEGDVVLDGGGVHGIVALLGVDQKYAFHGIQFENGLAEAGGAVLGMNRCRVDFDMCRFLGNRATTRGAAVSLRQAKGAFRRCVFERNLCGGASSGGTIEIGLGCTIEVDRCVLAGNEADVGGGLFAGDTAALIVKSCTFAHNRARRKWGGNAIFLFGATSSGPSGHVANSVFTERDPFGNDPSKTSKLYVTSSAFTAPAGDRAPPAFEEVGRNTHVAPELVGAGPEAWALAEGSAGRGTADPSRIDGDATDFRGNLLVHDRRADPGALAARRR